jgi:hypothetical protein
MLPFNIFYFIGSFPIANTINAVIVETVIITVIGIIGSLQTFHSKEPMQNQGWIAPVAPSLPACKRASVNPAVFGFEIKQQETTFQWFHVHSQKLIMANVK